MLSFLVINFALSSKIIEYRFGSNFGQIFFDYSGNLNLAVNGDSSLDTIRDTIGSSKGVYLYYSPIRYITLPPNDVSSNINLLIPYSLLTWTRMRIISQGTIFYRGIDINNYYTIETEFNTIGLLLKVVVNSVVYIASSLEFIACCKAVWSLLSLTIQTNTFSLYVNGVLFLDLTLTEVYQDPSGINKMMLGYSPVDATQTYGLVWNFIVMSGVPVLTNYYSGTSNVCLSIGACTPVSCTPSIIDPDYGIGCLTTTLCGNQATTSCEWVGGGPSCSTVPCLNCNCGSKSCYIANSAAVCKIICSSGFYFDGNSCVACNSECKNCLSSHVCVSCIALNAAPSSIQGCVCNSGYYNSTALTALTTCNACNSDCIDCTVANLCSSCKDVNAIPSATIGCDCKATYYYNSLHICDNCHSDCASCNTPNLCISCKDKNSVPSQTAGCVCAIGFYFNTTYMNCTACGANCFDCSSYGACNKCVKNNMYSDNCLLCDVSCTTCLGPRVYDCTSCNVTWLSGVCFEKCPVGYVNFNKTCKLVSESNAIFKFDFQEVGSVFHDSVNGFEAVISRKPRNLQQNMPQAVYKRGVYFPGSVPLLLNSSQGLLFGDSFTISTWIKPESVNGTIFCRTLGNQTLIQVYFLHLMTNINVILDKHLIVLNSSDSLGLNDWNHILLTVNYSLYTSIAISINRNTTSYFNISSAPFIDNQYSATYIGTNNQYNDSFSGFMYILEAYTSLISLDLFVNYEACIGGCAICPSHNICLPFCSINQFYSEDAHLCSTCPKNCPLSCKSGSECNLCADDFCDECRSFGVNSCNACISGYEVVNNLCLPCDSSAYYNTSTKICDQCAGMCKSCISYNLCTECAENSMLNDNNECVCRESFKLINETCYRVGFNAKIMISKDNVVTIIFEQPLKDVIQKNNLIIQIDGKLYPYDLLEIDNSTYKITPVIDSSVQNGSTIHIYFVPEIYSIEGFLLETNDLQGKLFITQQLLDQRTTQVKADKAKKLAGKGTTVGASAALGISLLNLNPATFFDFLNTAEMFYSVYLLNLNLHPILSEFLVGLRFGWALMPNIFMYAFEESQGVPLNVKYRNYGYNTNLVFLNCGLQLMTLIIFFIAMLLLLPLARIKWCKIRMKRVFESFKYGVFLRFWLQTSFEMLTACSVGIKFSKFENTAQIIDYTFCILFLLGEFFCLVLLVYVVKARAKLINEDEIKEYKSLYSTFFEEFKDIGVSRWLFYLIYILRRSALILCYNFIPDGLIQLFISLIFSVSIPLYIITTRNFENNIYNVYHFFNELTIGAFNFVLFITIINGTISSSEAAANLCLNFITVAWGMNIGVSIYNTTTSIVSKVKYYLKKRRDRRVFQLYGVTTGTNAGVQINALSEIDFPTKNIQGLKNFHNSEAAFMCELSFPAANLAEFQENEHNENRPNE